MTVGGSLIYEEIGDPKSSFTYSQNVLYGQSSTTASHKSAGPLPTGDQEVQAVGNVKKSSSYIKSIASTTGVTLDSVPEACAAVAPSDQVEKAEKLAAEHRSLDNNAVVLQLCSAYGIANEKTITDDYILMQAAENQSTFKVKCCSAYGIALSADGSCDFIESCDPSLWCDSCRSCDPSPCKGNCEAAETILEKTCDPDDQTENSGTEASSLEESCNMEKCPAYGIYHP